jgi:hypothetical protein
MTWVICCFYLSIQARILFVYFEVRLAQKPDVTSALRSYFYGYSVLFTKCPVTVQPDLCYGYRMEA